MRRCTFAAGWWVSGFLLVSLSANGCQSAGSKVAQKPPAKPQSPPNVVEELQIEKTRKEKPTAQMLTDFGLSQAAAKNYWQAEQMLTHALEVDHRYVPAYVGFARIMDEQNRYDRALEILEKGRRACGKAPEIWNEIGVAKAKLNDYRGALEAMQHAVAADGKNPLFVANLANLLAAHGELKQSYELFTRIMPPADARYQIAGILYGQNRPNESAQQLELALAVDPKHPKAQEMLRFLENPDVKQASFIQAEDDPRAADER